MRIYIACPYTPKSDNKHTCIQEAQHNVDRAIAVAVRLIDKGHIPFVPTLSHYIHISPFCRKDYGELWYKIDQSFITDWAEALYYVDKSKGTDGELKLAKKLGLKIFYSIDEIPDGRKDKL